MPTPVLTLDPFVRHLCDDIRLPAALMSVDLGPLSCAAPVPRSVGVCAMKSAQLLSLNVSDLFQVKVQAESGQNCARLVSPWKIEYISAICYT